jgi:acylphosphatase
VGNGIIPNFTGQEGANVARTKRSPEARRYFVSGRVQGVGYRYFVEKVAGQLDLTGYARNLEDGRVEVYAAGAPERLSELAGYLWKGPSMADVRGVEEREAAVEPFSDFRIEHF